MSRSQFTVTCQQCRAAFSTPFPQETAHLRCPGCAREAPGREFDYARMAHFGLAGAPEQGDVLFAPAKSTAFERRGEWILFKCPHCEWAMRIQEALSATSLVDCGRCGLEILPPDPEAGTPATLTAAGALRLGRTSPVPTSCARGGEAAVGMRGGSGGPERPGERGPQAEAVGSRFEDDPWRPAGMEGHTDPVFREVVREAAAGGARGEDALVRQARVFRRVVIAGIAVLSVLGVVVRFHESGQGELPNAPAALGGAANSAAPPAAPDPIRARAEALGRELAAQGDWQALLPFVRHRERVEPIMADYYSRHPLVPLRLVGFDPPVSVEVGGRRYLQMGAVSDGGERRVVGFEESGDGGLAFDWEVYADIAADQWASFRSERPVSARSLRFAFILASVADRYYEDAGVPREQGIAVRIWFRDREDSLVAVFPKDRFAGVMIDRVGRWDVGKLVIGDLAFPAGSSLPDRVDFQHLLQERWLVTGEREEPLF